MLERVQPPFLPKLEKWPPRRIGSHFQLDLHCLYYLRYERKQQPKWGICCLENLKLQGPGVGLRLLWRSWLSFGGKVHLDCLRGLLWGWQFLICSHWNFGSHWPNCCELVTFAAHQFWKQVKDFKLSGWGPLKIHLWCGLRGEASAGRNLLDAFKTFIFS